MQVFMTPASRTQLMNLQTAAQYTLFSEKESTPHNIN